MTHDDCTCPTCDTERLKRLDVLEERVKRSDPEYADRLLQAIARNRVRVQKRLALAQDRKGS